MLSRVSKMSATHVQLRVHKMHDRAHDLMRGSPFSAGLDVSTPEAFVIPARSRLLVKTGLRVSFNPGWYMRVAPRSGLALKHGIDCGAGVIDSDYRSEIGVLLFNLGDADVSFNAGDRIAQLILERIPDVVDITYTDELDTTDRGEGGFGSTGLKHPRLV
ncbi:mitochondrial deoxyuridine 5'-triphosphate nucleotidohydrolase family (dUTP pyrophosphatase) [Andalucia godoyi]|uniref:Deoxyuridine 5'-triphosphate nucleotidohydrolase n=1 Tax=Andalucia godoyi TaxID=505711 RepID=A0A8K0AI24_ANDGO|nr:mitochondrial deoxyuridine 5'-triphosphate nucleotidohydrolase family (dUTP pyrophosphatase) [Andalucia godoyi]|eukprot:ANDGO_08224.mRNA.1 mitochondrial deoxyuridine 5'-triphosphate nucleotidohydrolase family (dUTP pyrophosphatase)